MRRLINVRKNFSRKPKIRQHLRLAVRYAAARNATISEARLKHLARDPEPGVHTGVAENFRTSEKTLDRLLRDDELEVRLAVVENPRNLPARPKQDDEEELHSPEQIVTNSGINVRLATAGNHRTSAIILEQLARDGDERVRLTATGNPYMPLEALKILSTDEDPFVRYAGSDLAKNNPI